MPAPQHWGPPQPWDPPPNLPPGGPGYGANPQFMPPRPQDNYYPPPNVPPMEKQPHYAISAYGREAPPSGVSASGNQPPPHVASQVSCVALDQNMMDAFEWLVREAATDSYVFFKR